MKTITLLFLCLAIFAKAKTITLLDTGNAPEYIAPAVSNVIEATPISLVVTNGTLRVINSEAGTNLWISSEAHDWGSYLPTGADNPNPYDAVVINRKLSILPDKHEWSAVGASYVLTCENATFTAESGEASTTWTFCDGSRMQWVAESSAVVGAMATAISGDETHLYIDYAAKADAATLALYRADSPNGTYSVYTNVTWTQTDAATRRATIPYGNNMSGFFRAQVAETYPAHVLHENAQLFEGGIMTSSDDSNPVIYDSTVEITVGGHTYRIPAQLVE